MKKREKPKEFVITARFVDLDGNVIYESMEEAFSKMSQGDQDKLMAKIKTATTGKKHVAG